LTGKEKNKPTKGRKNFGATYGWGVNQKAGAGTPCGEMCAKSRLQKTVVSQGRKKTVI